MMEDFVDELENKKMQLELYRTIQGRGAFRRFKDGVRRLGIEQQWYDYRDKKYVEFAIYWCKENGIRWEMD